MKIKVIKLDETAQLPTYAREGDAGMDLKAIAPCRILPGDTALIPTGLAVELPPNAEAQVRPRSGLALKHAVTVLNTPGTIDAGYRGEIAVILINHGKQPFQVEVGMRIAQMVVAPVVRADIELVTALSESSRGEGGFGSTGTYATGNLEARLDN